MLLQTSEDKKPWQKRTWVQLLAIGLGVLPAYIPVFLSNMQRDQPLSSRDILFYTLGLGSTMIVVILLLLRYLCGERLQDLNLKDGKWWKDILAGAGLSVLTLAILLLLSGPLQRILPSEPQSGLGGFFDEMVASPWLFALLIGPSLIIGAGIFEELVRVFMLTRLWKIRSNSAWKWGGVFISAAIFGMMHLYQGVAGVIMTGIYGLIMAIYYLYFGRVAAMMIAHYLHDAIQFAMIFMMVKMT